MTTLNLRQAAELLNIHPATLQEKARTGEIPGARIGKCWVFIEFDLIQHIRAQYARRALQGEQKEVSLCHSSNAKIHPIGGSNYPTTDSYYSKVLGQSTGTVDKAKAKEYHDKLKASLWDQARLGVRPRRTWNEAVVRYLAETSHKASQVTDKIHLRWLDAFLNGVQLDAINREVLDRIVAARRAEGVKNSSVNRVMEVVSAVLRKAFNEWEWLDRVPRVQMLPEAKPRIRWITKDDAQRLIATMPPHLAAMVRFSLETGLRRSNVTGLQWSQIDLARRTAWIHSDQAKARQAIAVPLSAAAVIVLREQVGKHPTHVFSYRGKPVTQVNTKAWAAGLKRAAISNFRWHDLRHTWASWHVQAGTPVHVLQELGGWECVEMVRKYAHLSSEHLIGYVDRASDRQPAGNGKVATIRLRT